MSISVRTFNIPENYNFKVKVSLYSSDNLIYLYLNYQTNGILCLK